MNLLSEFVPYKGAWFSNEEYIFRHTSVNNHFYLSFLKSRIGYVDGDTDQEIIKKANDYISTLSNTKVYYPMQTPIETEIELSEFKTYEDYTKIEVLTEVAPSKIEATYYGYTME